MRFSNGCISIKTSLINAKLGDSTCKWFEPRSISSSYVVITRTITTYKLGDVVNLDVLCWLHCMWIKTCSSHVGDCDMVGHVRNMMALWLPTFLKRQTNNKKVMVKGNWVNRGGGYGLEIPLKYTFESDSLSLTWLKNKLVTPVLSISFKEDDLTGKVGGSLLLKRPRHELARGVWGHAPPQKILTFKCLEMLFSTFSRQYLGLKHNQNYDYINHILCLLQPLFSSKSQSLAFRKEWNDDSSNADSKKCIQFFKLSKHVLQLSNIMSASVSLRVPFWHMRKPGIKSCENVSTTLRSPQSALYFHRKCRVFLCQ